MLTVICGLGISKVQAADQTFSGGANGNNPAWLTVGNWVGGAFPGSNAGVTGNTDVATIPSTGNMIPNATIGINLNFSGNTLYLGAIVFSGTTNRAVGDSSATSGTLQLNGATVNGVGNVILRHTGTATFTLQNNGGGAGLMPVALGNTTENKVLVDGAGSIVIGSVVSGSGKNLTLAGSGSGSLVLTNVNTYTGNTTISAGKLMLTNMASIANSPNIIIGSGATFDVSSLTTALTLSSGQKLRADGATASATNLTAAIKGLTVGTGGLMFTNFNGTLPPLSVAGAGSITLASGNSASVYVSNGGTPLSAGDYKLISIGTGNTTAVTGTAPSIVTVGGDGLVGGTAASLLISGGELFLHVVAGTPKITVTLPGQPSANTGSPSDQTAGTSFNVTLRATTDGTAVNTAYNGVKSISFSGPTGSPIYPGTVTFSSGVGTASITLTKVETPTLTATDGTIAGMPSSSFNVASGAIDHYVVVAGAIQVVGAPFNVTATAKDAYENTVTTDSSTSVTMSSGSGNVQFDVNPVTLASGTFVVSATDNTLETTTITATDGNSKTGTTGSITINPVPKYRTKQSGNWGDFTTWQEDFGSGFVDATSGQTPTSVSADTVEIRNGHTVTVAAPVTVDQVTVDAGGQIVTTAALTLADGDGTDMDVFGILNSSVAIVRNSGATIVVESGGKYLHNFASGGTIPTATWISGSTCEVTNQTTGNSLSGLGQAFHNFTWNCPNQGAAVNMAGSLVTVNGNLTVINTGIREFRLAANNSPTITIGGNWVVQGGTNVACSGTGSPIINLAGNLVVSGGGLNLGSGAGTTTVNASGNVSATGGALMLSATTGNFNFAKTGTQTFASGGTITGPINWTVNDGSTLDTGASTIGGTGTFTVSGLGAVTGGGTITGAATVNGTLSPGTVSTIGTLTFASAPTFASTTTNYMKINRNGGTPLADKVVVSSGALAYAGNLVVANIGAALQVNDTFTLFAASGYSNPFDTTLLPVGYTWDTSPLLTSGAITVTAVAGGSPVLNMSASGGILTFNWIDPSFNLQSSTNVAGPYVTIPGAVTGFTTNASLSIVPNQFFRLSN